VYRLFALDVDEIEDAVLSSTELLGTGPAKRKPGCADCAVVEPPLELVLLENPGKGGSIDHLGVEVADSATLHAQIARLADQGLFTDEGIGTTCCFATQDKGWVTGPGSERWEVYTVLADSDTSGSSPTMLVHAGQAPDSGVCCGVAQAEGARSSGMDERAAAAACC
jgi:lactoylglutathione lyase